MNVFINPNTLESEFDFEEIQLVTEVNRNQEGFFQFRILLHSGTIKTLSFSGEEQAYQVYREVCRHMNQ